ncbi:MAG TPA: hypothetical protein VFU82_02580, partial [Gammaproteobacteria bacterium]|nr:hypothetical protein [Gammaproteobacteria bacterium]
MISITKNEIEVLLAGYQTRITENKKKSPFRSFTGRLPAIIVALDNFIKQVPDNHQLTPEELYTLITLLLNRKRRTNWRTGEPKSSEALAQTIEAKFETRRMDCFRACGALNTLDQNVFNFICNLDNLEALPKNQEDVTAWLKDNGLLPESEKAIAELEKSNALSSYLSNQNLSNLSQVSKGFRGLFKPALDTQQLGQLIIHADLDGAKKMIQAHPGLLTISLTVTDYSGRKIQGTALQLALGAEDIRYHDHEIAMVEMIMGELKKQPDGKRIIAQQIAEQFPEGWKADHQARVARDQAALNAFVTAIANSNNQADWEAAAEIYREHIDNENLGKGVIKTGLHCNAQLIAGWFHAYNENYAAFGDDPNSPKNAFLWQKGSYCQRYLTTPY